MHEPEPWAPHRPRLAERRARATRGNPKGSLADHRSDCDGQCDPPYLHRPARRTTPWLILHRLSCTWHLRCGTPQRSRRNDLQTSEFAHPSFGWQSERYGFPHCRARCPGVTPTPIGWGNSRWSWRTHPLAGAEPLACSQWPQVGNGRVWREGIG